MRIDVYRGGCYKWGIILVRGYWGGDNWEVVVGGGGGGE